MCCHVRSEHTGRVRNLSKKKIGELQHLLTLLMVVFILNPYNGSTALLLQFSCEIETVQHFILECPLYEDNRQRLQKNIFLQLGIPYLDMDLLLGYSENENIFGWRESIICELGQYIANTGRLFSKVADGNAPL